MIGLDEEFSDGEIIFEEKIVVFKNNFQVMKIMEFELGEILVNFIFFMFLFLVVDLEDWVLVGEIFVEFFCIMLVLLCC